MSQDDFTKLFKYMQDFRSAVQQRFDAADKAIAETSAAVAELGAQLRTYHEELLPLAH